MSSVDNRIVRMKFDNAQFEAGVSKSMSTLDKLKEKLMFKDASKAVDDWQTKLSNVNFNAIEDSLKFLQNRFSATGEFVYKIWDKITDKGLEAFKKLESATIGQIKSGGWTRAMNLANAQFQVEGLNYSWEKIFAAADYGVTDTAYGLDSAAKAASQLAASGIDFEKTLKTVNGTQITQMHQALRGISGLAAMTNSSFDDIANIFTRVAGTGRVFATDLNSIAARGINATATLAKHLKKTEADIKEMVRKGQIDFKTFSEAMDDAYGEHAKEANQTFTGSLSNMKAALSRIGAIFAQPVINNTNRFFNALTSKIKIVQKSLQDVTKTNEKTKKSYVEQTRFATHFAETYTKAVEVAVKVVERLDMTWFQKVADRMDKAVLKIKSALDFLDDWLGIKADDTEKSADKQKKSLDKMVATQEEYEAAMTILFKDRTLSGKKRVTWLEKQGLDPKRVQKYIDSVVAAGYNTKKASIKVEKANKEIATSSDTAQKALEKLPISVEQFNNMGAAGQEEFLKKHKDLVRAYRDHDKWLQEIKDKQEDATNTARALNAVSEEYARMHGKDLKGNEYLFDFKTMRQEQREEIFKTYPQLLKVYDEAYNAPKNYANVGMIFKNLASATSNIVTNIKIIWKTAKSAFKEVFSFSEAISGTERFTGKLANLTKSLIITDSFAAKLRKVFVLFFKAIHFGITTISSALGKLMDFVAGLFKANEAVDKTGKSVKKTEGFFQSLFKIIKKIGKGLWNYISNIDTLLTKIGNTKGIQRLKDALSKLFTTTKNGVNDTVEPARSAFAKFADSFEMPSVDDVANAIGWIADKIAILIEKIPEWSAKVAGFFEFIVAKVKEFIGDIEFADIGGHIKSGIIDAFTVDDEEEKSITSFFENIKNAIFRFFNDTDWGKVKELSKFALVMVTLLETIRMFHNAGSMFKNVSDMFDGIRKTLASIRMAIAGVALGFDIASFGHLFAGLGIMIGGIAALMYVLSSEKITNEKMDQAVTIVAIIAGAAIAITAIVASMKKKINERSINQSGILNNLKIQLGAIGQIALLLAGMGAGIWLITKAMKEIVANEDLTKSAIAVGVIFGLLATFAIIMVKMLQKNDLKAAVAGKVGSSFKGIGTFFIFLGASLWVIAKAMNGLENVTWGKFAAMTVPLALMFGGMALVIKAISGLEKGQAWAAAGIMASFGAALTLTLIKIAAIGMLGWDRVLPGIAAVGTVMLGMATMMFAIGAAFKLGGAGNAKWIAAAVLAMGATIYLIGESLSELFRALSSENTDWDELKPVLVAFGGTIAIMAVTLLAMSKMIKDGSVKADDVLEIAASFIIMAVGVGIIAKSLELLSGISINAKTLAVFGTLIGIFTVLGVIAGAKGQFAAGLLSVGTAFLLLGAGMAALGAAIWIAGAGLPSFAEGLEKLFSTVEKHKVVALIVLVALGLAVYALVKALKAVEGVVMIVAKPLSGLFDSIGKLGGSIAKGIGSILKELKKGGENIVTWFKKLSPKMKAVLITLVSTLLATGLHLAPKVIDTFVHIMFIIIDKLMEYADAIALKVVVLILRVITALANAINQSANAIVNAFLAVVRALLKLATVAFSKLVKVFFNVIGNLVGKIFPTVGNWIKNVGSKLSGGLDSIAEGMTSGITEAISETNGEIKALDGQIHLTTGSIGGQSSALDTLCEKLGLTKDKTDKAREAQEKYDESLWGQQTHSFAERRARSEEKLKEDKDYELPWYQQQQDLTKLYGDAEFQEAQLGELERRANKVLSSKGWDAYTEFLEKNKNKFETMRKNLEDTRAFVRAMSQDFGGTTEQNKRVMDQIWDEVSESVLLLTGEKYDFKTMDANAREGYMKANPEILNIYNYRLRMASQLNETINSMQDSESKLLDKMKNEAKKAKENRLPDMINRLLSLYVYPEGGQIASDYSKDYYDFFDKYLSNLPDDMLAYLYYAIQSPDAFSSDVNVPTSVKTRVQTLIDNILAGVFPDYDPGSNRYAGDRLQEYLRDAFNEFVGEDLFKAAEVDLPKVNAEPMVNKIIIDTAEALKHNRDNRYSKISNAMAERMEAEAKSAGKQVEKDGLFEEIGTELKTEMRGVGDNGVSGLTEAFTDSKNQTFAEKAVRGFFRHHIVRPSQEELDEHSPSKVMASIGGYAIDGLIVGMTDKATSLKSTATDMISGLISQFSSGGTDITQAFTSSLTGDGGTLFNAFTDGYQMDMGIQPVLDTSSIMNGSQSIGAMLGNQSLMIDGFSGQLAADITSLDSRNSQGVNEIRQLRNEMAEMSGAIQSMRIYLDTGALVGGIADPMDNRLGARAIYARRGN